MKLKHLLQNKQIEHTNKGPQHARAEAIEVLCDFMDDDPKESFKYWLGRTKRLKPHEIHAMIKKCKREGKNPQGLFVYLLKNG